jgi:cyclase
MPHDPASTPEVIEVAEGFYVRQAVDNIAWMDMGDGMLVVDALEQDHLEKDVLAAMQRTVPDTPVRTVLNTHTHHDHIALNNAFAQHFGADIFNMRDAEIPKGGRWFEGPKRKVRMIPVPGIHTDTDCLVWGQTDRVLFTGDLFGWGLIPTEKPLVKEVLSDIEGVYNQMLDLHPETVIPGHGPVCTAAELKRWLEYFHWLIAEVKRLKQEGRSDAEIRSQLTAPEDMADWWRFTDWKHEDSLGKVLKSID